MSSFQRKTAVPIVVKYQLVPSRGNVAGFTRSKFDGAIFYTNVLCKLLMVRFLMATLAKYAGRLEKNAGFALNVFRRMTFGAGNILMLSF